MDLPDSESSTDSSENGGGEGGLTLAARSIGEGQFMYLQTMKTISLLFIFLSILNLPVYLIFTSNTQNNNYGNIATMF